MTYEVVMGIEVHVELSTESKLFCACSAKFGAEANRNVCPACMGMPGMPPVLNRHAVELAIKAGIVTGCEIARRISFDKKNYYYPDLPAGYQITQMFEPICRNGHIDVETPGGVRRIGIKQMHIEEDAGKLVHDASAGSSLVDFNRTGVPLIEIVSNPDFRNADEVLAYLESLKALLTFAGVSDCRMQEGSMRADINISVREKGSEELGTRTEMKNLNSLKAIRRAIEYESERHIDALETGFEELVQETRRWDDDRCMSFSMRSKEDAADYRYFPDSEIPPVIIDDEWVQSVRESVPELAGDKRRRYTAELGLSEQASRTLTSSKALADVFDDTMRHCSSPKEAANWITVELLNLVKSSGAALDDVAIDGEKIAKLIGMVDSKAVNRTVAKEIFAEMYRSGADPEEYSREKGLGMVADEGLLLEAAKQALAENPASIAEYKSGNMKVFGFFMGMVMRKTGGKADPAAAGDMLRRLLDEAQS